MFKKFVVNLSIAAMLLLAACGPAATTAAPTQPPATAAPATKAPPPTQAAPAVVKATPGKSLKMVFLPKFLGKIGRAHV